MKETERIDEVIKSYAELLSHFHYSYSRTKELLEEMLQTIENIKKIC